MRRRSSTKKLLVEDIGAFVDGAGDHVALGTASSGVQKSRTQVQVNGPEGKVKLIEASVLSTHS